jgi:hypothetical protein
VIDVPEDIAHEIGEFDPQVFEALAQRGPPLKTA